MTMFPDKHVLNRNLIEFMNQRNIVELFLNRNLVSDSDILIDQFVAWKEFCENFGKKQQYMFSLLTSGWG